MSEPNEPIRVVHGDLTRQDVDAIVNAANEHLQHGGGVAAALVRAGGPIVQVQSDAWLAKHGPLESGRAAITGAGAMPARWIIHVAGPRFRSGQDNEALLHAAVEAALSGAASTGATSVALPAISAGVFGYPLGEATKVIAGSCRKWLETHSGMLAEIRLVGHTADIVTAFEEALS